jgi:hypothetical protein
MLSGRASPSSEVAGDTMTGWLSAGLRPLVRRLPMLRGARSSGGARVLAAGTSGVLVVGVTVLGLNNMHPSGELRLRSGAAWLTSNAVGQLTLLNGATADVSAQVPVGHPGGSLASAQRGTTGYAVDLYDGSVSVIDGGTFRPVHRAIPLPAVPPGTRMQMHVLVGRENLYALDGQRGLLAVVDSATLVPRRQPMALPARVTGDNAVTDAAGQLWVLDPATGDVVWYGAGRLQARAAAAEPGSSALTVVDGNPVVVDPLRRRAEMLDPQTGRSLRTVRLEPGADGTVTASGAASGGGLYVLSPAARQLTVCSFATGSCTGSIQLGPGDGGQRPDSLGVPVAAGGRVLVPDYGSGRVWIVDPAGMRVVAQPDLFGRPYRFELRSHDGVVFYNDPASEQAGVIELDGRVRRTSKYRQAKPVAGPGSGSGAGDKPRQVAPARPPDRTRPAEPGGPPSLGSGATPGPGEGPRSPQPGGLVSIEVRPGLSGAVKQEFELTARARRGASVASALWTFGDGTVGDGTRVRHRWSAAGIFPVKLTATLADGRRAWASVRITVAGAAARLQLKQIRLNPDQPSVRKPVTFSAELTGTADRWAWTVLRSDGGRPERTSNARTFRHEFRDSGAYKVLLEVTGGGGSVKGSLAFHVVPPIGPRVECGVPIKVSTTLDRDLPCPDTGLIIGASHITLDLGGHTITGPHMVTGLEARGGDTPLQDLRITNGEFTGFGRAMHLESTSDVLISNVIVRSDTEPLDGLEGVWMLLSENVQIIKSTLHSKGAVLGIDFSSGVSVSQSAVTGGVRIFESGSTALTNNPHLDNASISVVGSAKTVIEGNQGERVSISVNGDTENETSSRDTRIQDNKIDDSPIEDGVFIGNGALGTRVIGNMFSGNRLGIYVYAMGPAEVGEVSEIRGNTFRENRSAGIFVYAPSGIGTLAVTDNTFERNGLNPEEVAGDPVRGGLFLDLPDEAPVDVTANTVSHNAGYGIDVYQGSIRNGTGNFSSNGQEGCRGVECRPLP